MAPTLIVQLPCQHWSQQWASNRKVARFLPFRIWARQANEPELDPGTRLDA